MNIEIEKLFTSKHVAIKLKDEGFDEPCFGFFTGNNEEIDICESLNTNTTLYRLNKYQGRRLSISAPTHEQCVNWLNSKGIEIVVFPRIY
ncbi:MAG: hypothetical protein AABY22_25140, partial [Nanoarchaeota archaeon]